MFDIEINSDVHNYNTIASKDFRIVSHNLTMYSKNPVYAGVRFFNSLLKELREICSTCNYNNELYQYLVAIPVIPLTNLCHYI